MKKLTWLIVLGLFCARIARAQQADPVQPDSVADSVAGPDSGRSAIFEDFSATLKWSEPCSVNVGCRQCA